MAIVCSVTKTVYAPVPKIASTSLKYLHWKLETGRYPTNAASRFVERLLGGHHAKRKKLRIQALEAYRTRPFEPFATPEGHEVFAVVRDPAARLKSAWKSKATPSRFAHDGSAASLEALGLPLSPSFGEFIRHFDEYRRLSRVIEGHTRPYSFYLGEDPARIDHLFRLEDMAALEAYLSRRAGFPVTIDRQNKSPATPRDETIDQDGIERIRQITAADYALLGNLYSFDKAAARLVRGQAGGS